MKGHNRPSIALQLGKKEYQQLKSAAEKAGLSVQEMAEKAIEAGMKNKFKSPSKAPVVNLGDGHE